MYRLEESHLPMILESYKQLLPEENPLDIGRQNKNV